MLYPKPIKLLMPTWATFLGGYPRRIAVVIPTEKQHCSITEGCITRLFNHTLQFSGPHFLTGSVGKDHVPDHSVAFWVADKDLMKHDNSFQGKSGVYYLYGSYRIKYVGFQTPLDCIPQGTVLRMSLANWWKKGDSDEERCYLQLSGWYV